MSGRSRSIAICRIRATGRDVRPSLSRDDARRYLRLKHSLLHRASSRSKPANEGDESLE